MSKHTFPYTVHVTQSGLTAFGEVWYQWQEIEITEERYEDSKDRHGDSWLDLDEAAQVTKWGYARFAEGPAPEGAVIGRDDVSRMDHLRHTALEDLKLLPSAERAAAKAAAYAKYGAPDTGQRSAAYANREGRR